MAKKQKILEHLDIMIEDKELEIKYLSVLMEIAKHNFNNAEHYDLSDKEYFEIYSEFQSNKIKIEEQRTFLDGLTTARDLIKEA